ncbi:hypothetical protein Trco_004613, partial [Trichoderma cornu-damae]
EEYSSEQVSPREGNPPDDGDNGHDDESALDSDAGSSTASITSSIMQYREIHGRRLHIETGTAQCCDFADEYPDAQVIGTDISPIQPTWVPPNLQFEVEDCTQEWKFRSGDFDYVHMRWLVGSIQDWNALMQKAYRVLRPGGYIESLETSAIMSSDDGTVTETCAMGQWGKLFVSGGKKIGRPFTVVEDGTQRKSMEAAGFVDVEEFNFKMPIGGWAEDPRAKELGHFAQIVLERDVEGYTLFMANTLGWMKDEILAYIGTLRRDLRSGNFHAYYNQKVVWARKPLDGQKT